MIRRFVRVEEGRRDPVGRVARTDLRLVVVDGGEEDHGSTWAVGIGICRAGVSAVESACIDND